MTVTLRDYQSQVISDTYNMFAQGFNKVLLYAPTAAGKSILIGKMAFDFVSKRNKELNVASTAIRKPNKVLIIVHRTKLALQLEKTLKKVFSIEPGMIIAGSKPNYNNHTVFIAMAQTLENRDLPRDVGLLVGDEIHELGFFKVWSECYDRYLGSVWALGNCFVVGLTATPWRTKKKEGFCQFFDAKVACPSPLELIDQGHLTPGEMFSYAFENEDMLTTDQGDYTISSLTKAFNDVYVADVVHKWEQTAKTKKTIAFTPSVKSCKTLTSAFHDAGYTADYITAKDSEEKRNQKYNDFRDGVIQILVSVSTLTTGYDEPSIECVLIARPTKSLALLVQMIGRGLRLFDGKTSCIILDCGGCFNRIKKVQDKKIINHLDVSYSRLCPPSSKPPMEMSKVCKDCEEIINHFAKFCPHCGCEFKSVPKEKPSSVLFPEIEKYMTDEMMIERHYVFTEMRKAFKKGKSPTTVMSKFIAKYKHKPDKDYFLHCIFDGDQSKLAQQLLRDWCAKYYASDNRLLSFFSDLEFGMPDREYILDINRKYTRKTYLEFEFDYDLESIGNYNRDEWKEFYMEQMNLEVSPLTLAMIRK